MKMKKLTALALSALMLLSGVVYLPVTASDPAADYPELVITEIGVDQYGDAADAANVNKGYKTIDARRNSDPYEFIEIYNNSTKSINVYDYMLAYQGAGSNNAEWFEHSIQCYTPFHPGSDWWDGAFSENDSYWRNTKDVKPVNPARADGVIAPGEVFVAWIYNTSAHTLHCTLDDFRTFWGIDKNVKVFLLDGNDVDTKTNFSLKNQTTGTYLIMHQSERFPARRSADVTYYVEMDNTHHNYAGKHYSELDEVISWAVVDYRTDPIKSYAAANGGSSARTNFTISYLPFTGSTVPANGYTEGSVGTLRRVIIEGVNERAAATVGKLNDAQKAAYNGRATSIVRTEPTHLPVLTPSTTRPAILITELGADQLSTGDPVNPALKSSPGKDAFEFMELYNNTDGEINIYDYMVGYQGGGATGVSTYFERSVQEYTPIFPGADWFDAPYTAYDSFWKNQSVPVPVNPDYKDGVMKAGEVIVLWLYNSESHSINATTEQFRKFWSVPDGVKVFLLDANSARDRNFNIKNSDTGEYFIMQESDRFQARRSDDETYYVEADRTDCRYYDTDNFDNMPEIISWAVLDFGCYDPLYSLLLKSSVLTNYTYHYVPFTGEKKFINGYLTVTFDSQKRMHLDSYESKLANANVGTLTEAQKSAITKAKTVG